MPIRDTADCQSALRGGSSRYGEGTLPSRAGIVAGNFAVDMRGFPDRPQQAHFGWDIPASYHHRAGTLSFADGHSEIHRWLDARTMAPIRRGVSWEAAIDSPNNRDILWLQERTTRNP
ncbi:MAG: hypothetical protein HYY24_09955 [Verrucomicrobia bacterium]|nr:hypothetical protein [Verrucomicrobiota bacterium]